MYICMYVHVYMLMYIRMYVDTCIICMCMHACINMHEHVCEFAYSYQAALSLSRVE